jgi:hypothetical protein
MPRMIGLSLALLLASAAHAAPALKTLTLQRTTDARDRGLQDLFGPSHRSATTVIASDALYGGIAGLAIGAGVALLNNDFSNGGNWGRDLAIGAGAGLIIGGLFGVVDAASSSDRLMSESTSGRLYAAVADRR